MDETLKKSSDRERSHHRLQALQIRTYPAGKEIVSEGDEPLCFFVVLNGQVRLSTKGKAILNLADQDIFGLENIVLKHSCFYTATALSESRIAAYGPEALDHFIRRNPRMTRNILASILRQLARVTRDSVWSSDSFSIEEVDVRFFQDGEVIIEEGTRSREFYRLVSTQGGLRVSIRNEELPPIVTPGEFFGEIAGLLHLPRQATVTSMGESVVERYDLESVESIIRDYPEIAVQMMRTLISRLIEMNVRLTEKDI
ncbi:cyclic nucleotide-binding domain-containing protein [Desulfoferrobacter suflitae]|uniref:cyclic nucleotide-binding domain-containing protein n=1 Tax=Desulfoferrobacter suflitae TaxID=2865782 RepID=UPI002164AC89|nr:cyclic nucleotide-binding domain-containing protein [Desulfoferrobacter suflitae]MCK8602553.1 cyclic nucleotide-binding domain-containing protein [Desulfoferrobacter suflitae]